MSFIMRISDTNVLLKGKKKKSETPIMELINRNSEQQKMSNLNYE